MCPPKCRNVTDNVTTHVDVFGRAHRPSPYSACHFADNHFVFSAAPRPPSQPVLVDLGEELSVFTFGLYTR